MTRKQALFLKAIGVRLNQKFTCDFTEDYVYVIREDKDNFLQVYSIKENGEEVKTDSIFFYMFLHHDLHIIGDILDKEEKKYLEAVCKPFKDKIIDIRLNKYEKENIAFVNIVYTNNIENKKNTDDWRTVHLQEFEYGTMYTEMQLNRPYSLEDLKMFENDEEDE